MKLCLPLLVLYDIKMNKIGLYFCLIILQINNSLLAQPGTVLPSPQGSGLVRMQSVPVDMYTGIPQIYESLYNLPHPSGRSIPVGLSYHAGGIKVQDLAGPVGLGWQLQAGGMITRVVKGIPDTDGGFWDPTKPDDEKFPSITSGLKDGEHDDFFYQAPGISGKFQVGKDGESIMQMPKKDLLISMVDGFDNGWVIVDNYGVRYYFGSTASSRESLVKTPRVGNIHPDWAETEYIATWYLDRIEYPDHSIPVSFTYGSAPDFTYYYYANAYQVKYDPGVETKSINRDTKIEVKSPKYIKSISNGPYSIKFDWNKSGRQDLSTWYLNNVSINYNNSEVSSFKLKYFYFSSEDSFFENFIGVIPSCNDANCKRLGLSKLILNSKGKSLTHREFEYFKDDDDSTTDWNNNSLPPRNSRLYDHWGYSNGTTSSNLSTTLRVPINEHNGSYNPALRNANSNFSRAWSIRKIKKVSGEEVTYHLESNGLYGGLRVGGIDYYDPASDDTYTESYTYSSPVSYGVPTYMLHIEYQQGGTTIKKYTYYSSSEVALFDQNGAAVGYRTVTKTTTNGGKIVYTFNTLTQRPDDDATLTVGGSVTVYPELSPKTSKFWERGTVEETRVYDAEDVLLHSSDPEYSFDVLPTEWKWGNLIVAYFGSNNLEGFDFIAGTPTTIELPDNFVVFNYDSYSSYMRLSEISVIKETNADTEVLTEYFYHDDWRNFVDEIETTYADGSKKRIINSYVTDICTPDATWDENDSEEVQGYWTAFASRMIANPVESQSWYARNGVNYNLTGASLQTFQTVGTTLSQLIVPLKKYSLEIEDGSTSFSAVSLGVDGLSFSKDSRYKDLTEYIFNNDGRISSQRSFNGNSISYGWGYGNTIITSESINEDFTTNYTHIPLVGVKTITDPNGQVTEYEYDAFNRLRVVWDATDPNNKEILKRHRYHYDGQDEDLSATVTDYGLNLVDSDIIFTSNHAASFYGNTVHYWDFGDGTVLETPDHEVTHAYSSTGIYSVKLTLINPEYDPIQTMPYNQNIKSQMYQGAVCFTKNRYNQCDDTYEVTGTGCLAAGPPSQVSLGVMSSLPAGGAYCNPFVDYNWSYRLAGNTYWTSISGSNPSITLPTIVLTREGTNEFKCILTDECGNSFEATGNFIVEYDCGGGGGDGDLPVKY